MAEFWKEAVWQQSGAALKMLENAITVCPERVWGEKIDWHEFWYLTYHTLFFFDFYLTELERAQDFVPPEPFTLSELAHEGILPDQIYTKKEMLRYLDHGRRKCRESLQALTAEAASQPSCHRDGKVTRLELHLYNLRHVQHHTAQLNLLLRQQIDDAPRWVSKAGMALDE